MNYAKLNDIIHYNFMYEHIIEYLNTCLIL